MIRQGNIPKGDMRHAHMVHACMMHVDCLDDDMKIVYKDNVRMRKVCVLTRPAAMGVGLAAGGGWQNNNRTGLSTKVDFLVA